MQKKHNIKQNVKRIHFRVYICITANIIYVINIIIFYKL